MPRIPTWDELRTLGQSRAVKLTILMPLIGYMIISNEQLIGYFELSRQALSPLDIWEKR